MIGIERQCISCVVAKAYLVLSRMRLSALSRSVDKGCLVRRLKRALGYPFRLSLFKRLPDRWHSGTVPSSDFRRLRNCLSDYSRQLHIVMNTASSLGKRSAASPTCYHHHSSQTCRYRHVTRDQACSSLLRCSNRFVEGSGSHLLRSSNFQSTVKDRRRQQVIARAEISYIMVIFSACLNANWAHLKICHALLAAWCPYKY